MSSPKLAWVVCIMAALSLGGCAVDATGTDDLAGDDEASVAQWYLTNGASGSEDEDDGSTDDIDDETAPQDDIVAAELLGEEFSAQADPHPDPWKWLDGEEAAGAGNQD